MGIYLDFHWHKILNMVLNLQILHLYLSGIFLYNNDVYNCS